ncbi:MAG: ATP-binding protein [Bdellovibrionales bacterium]|nr:ATP-binding protein [Bdellovibrionales bacterium]
MEWLHRYQLSVWTLSCVAFLPFCYFGYQTKYRYRPDIRKRLDLVLRLVAVGIGGLILLKLSRSSIPHGEELLLTLLHFSFPILTLLIVSQVGLTYGPKRSQSQNVRNGEASTVESIKPLKAEVEKVGWDDIIISSELKSELLSIIELLREPKKASKYGIEVPKGILLQGPPGTGKTTIAKAMAHTAHLSFFALRTDEVISKWVGESEKNLSKLFQAAQKHAPSVIFIDEIDSIGKQRSGKGQQWAENLLNHLLQLIDGVVKTEGLYVIGATNRADLVDSALKRSGRLNRTIEITLPDAEARRQLLEISLRKLQLEHDVDVSSLVELTAGLSGADIKAICNQAGLNAFKRESGTGRRKYTVNWSDMEHALHEVSQGVSVAHQH